LNLGLEQETTDLQYISDRRDLTYRASRCRHIYMGVDIKVTIDTNSNLQLQRIDQHFTSRCSQEPKSAALDLMCQLSTFLRKTSQMQVCPVPKLIFSDIPARIDREGWTSRDAQERRTRLFQYYCTKKGSTDAIRLLNLFGSFPSRGCHEHIGQGLVQCDPWCVGMALVPGTELIHLNKKKKKKKKK
jgi:hypothetical protein